MRIIDLSVCLEAGIPSDPPFMLPEITYRHHTAGALEFAAIFKGLPASDLPDGQGAAIETLKLTTHNGTHMDAPWHFKQHNEQGRAGVDHR
jgi:kynurenine formamidase